ncbi:hypothetical protein VNO77_18395 [Canavalia gladiata]|uniref:HMA domain-containing protein n=1 Tax=Canavalia gladiata TaxID=3824 RepID=A0AAN9LQP9_CANGL
MVPVKLLWRRISLVVMLEEHLNERGARPRSSPIKERIPFGEVPPVVSGFPLANHSGHRFFSGEARLRIDDSEESSKISVAESCILKVNIHCNDCEQKVKKLLHKVHDEGKVVVTGNVDPAKLVKKLKRGGKHAEIWGDQKGIMYNQSYPIHNNHQFHNLQVNGGKVGKDNQFLNHKGQKGHGVGGQGQLPHFQNIKGAQDLKLPANLKENKSVKFNLSDEEFDGGDNGFDEHGHNFDDYHEEEGYGHGHAMHNNRMMPMMGDGRGPHGLNGPNMKSLKGNGGGGRHNPSVNKGDVIDQAMLNKGKGGNYNEAKNGNKGDQKGKNKEEEKHKQKNAKSYGGLLGRFLGFGKKSKKREEATYTNKNNNNWVENKEGKEGKKGGKLEEHSDNIKSKNKNDLDFFGYHDIHPDIKTSKSGKGSNGNDNVGPMGNNRMGNIPAMNGGEYYQGMQMQYAPYNLQQQQQYMGMMMNPQHQQQANMNDMYSMPMMHGKPHPSTNYMPPPSMPSHPMADPITHTFSDENVESCTVM